MVIFTVHPVRNRHLLLANYVTAEVLLLRVWRTSSPSVKLTRLEELYCHPSTNYFHSLWVRTSVSTVFSFYLSPLPFFTLSYLIFPALLTMSDSCFWRQHLLLRVIKQCSTCSHCPHFFIFTIVECTDHPAADTGEQMTDDEINLWMMTCWLAWFYCSIQAFKICCYFVIFRFLEVVMRLLSVLVNLQECIFMDMSDSCFLIYIYKR